MVSCFFAFSCFSWLCIYTCEFKGAVASFSLLWTDLDGERLYLKLNTEALAGWSSVSPGSGMPPRQSLLSISLSWNHLLLKLLEFSVAKTAAVLWMAVSARALVILRGEGCGGPFVLLYFLGEDILFEVILFGPRSGVLSLRTEVELWLWDQVVGSATVAPGSWDRDVFFMVVMLVSEVQACAHLLWNQGLHLWDSGQWSWPCVCVCVCWGGQQ